MFKLLILSRTLWGSWAQKPFCTSLFLDYRKKTSFSLYNLPWVPMGRLKQLLIREGTGCEDKGGTVKRNNGEALGQVLVPPQGIHKISLRSWASQVALVVKSPPAKAGDVRHMGSIPRSERSPGGGHGNPLQYYCLEKPKDRGAW